LWLAALLAVAGVGCRQEQSAAARAPGRELFKGVRYLREEVADPRPLVVHVVTVDLTAPGVGVLVTPGEPTDGRQLRARTTSGFLREFGVQVAVNGGFFEPWHTKGPHSYYPHAGDPVDAKGLAVSRGERYSPLDAKHTAVHVSKDNRAAVGEMAGPVWNAISGWPLLVEEGKPTDLSDLARHDAPHPRTAVGVDGSGRRLILVVVDGRQRGRSEGVRLAELGDLMARHGAHTAVNLDGGGSSSLVAEGENGQPELLSSPIHGGVRGMERPVANHLGVFARRRPTREVR